MWIISSWRDRKSEVFPRCVYDYLCPTADSTTFNCIYFIVTSKKSLCAYWVFWQCYENSLTSSLFFFFLVLTTRFLSTILGLCDSVKVFCLCIPFLHFQFSLLKVKNPISSHFHQNFYFPILLSLIIFHHLSLYAWNL